MADNVVIEVEERVEEYVIEIQESVVTVDSELTETSTNPVKSSGIWTWVKGLFTTHTTEADAHPASAISHKDSTVAERLDNITEGSISRDGNNNITRITTFGEATIINRNGEGIITGWENDTHEWTLTKTGDTITGWTLTEKP